MRHPSVVPMASASVAGCLRVLPRMNVSARSPPIAAAAASTTIATTVFLKTMDPPPARVRRPFGAASYPGPVMDVLHRAPRDEENVTRRNGTPATLHDEAEPATQRPEGSGVWGKHTPKERGCGKEKSAAAF